MQEDPQLWRARQWGQNKIKQEKKWIVVKRQGVDKKLNEEAGEWVDQGDGEEPGWVWAKVLYEILKRLFTIDI